MTDLPMTKADDDLVERLRAASTYAWNERVKQTINQSADEITRLRAQLAAAEAEGKEATKLLLRWSELSGAEDAAAGPDTFAFLGKENSAGWVWAREIQEERDFDAEQNRLRDLAIQCVTTAEERAVAAEAQLQAMRKALEPFALRAEAFDPDEGDDEHIAFGLNIKIGWLRAAREALRPLTEGAGKC